MLIHICTDIKVLVVVTVAQQLHLKATSKLFFYIFLCIYATQIDLMHRNLYILYIYGAHIYVCLCGRAARINQHRSIICNTRIYEFVYACTFFPIFCAFLNIFVCRLQ